VVVLTPAGTVNPPPDGTKPKANFSPPAPTVPLFQVATNPVVPLNPTPAVGVLPLPGASLSK